MNIKVGQNCPKSALNGCWKSVCMTFKHKRVGAVGSAGGIRGGGNMEFMTVWGFLKLLLQGKEYVLVGWRGRGWGDGNPFYDGSRRRVIRRV